MVNSDKAALIFADAIRDAYKRPVKGGRDPGELEVTLFWLHWSWAVIDESASQLQELKYDMIRREKANSGLWTTLKRVKPNSTHADGYKYVIHHWKTISSALGILGD